MKNVQFYTKLIKDIDTYRANINFESKEYKRATKLSIDLSEQVVKELSMNIRYEDGMYYIAQ